MASPVGPPLTRYTSHFFSFSGIELATSKVANLPRCRLANHLIYKAKIDGWWAREGSNLQPDGYEPPALTN